MASVCGGCLALLDAGVPLTTSVAGVAMGVLLDDVDDPVVLTDILGIEDALGGMDFKVNGRVRQFFTESFLGPDAALLAPPRRRAGVASMAWRPPRRCRATSSSYHEDGVEVDRAATC